MAKSLADEFKNELFDIADWWLDKTFDEVNGGFVGEITTDNRINREANKGVILNTRILWFFSEIAVFAKDQSKQSEYRAGADRAYKYLTGFFLDSVQGGVYWELDCRGQVLNSRKQIYAQAFAIYGLASYYKLSKDETALSLAYKMFELIEKHALDKQHEGYLEAFSGSWGELEDFRLSEKDLNSPKSMNTHLHILEAYTNLYAVDKHTQVGNAIRRCLQYFDKFIIDHESNHLRMFQAMDWTDLSDSWSYGHDIESSWLIWEAVEVLGDQNLKKHFRPIVLGLAEVCSQQAVGKRGELLDAFNFKTDKVGEERIWWVQAEALVGFLSAYGMNEDSRYKDIANNVWEFIKKYQKDAFGGEWNWLSSLDAPEVGDCKIGFWKAPYHNGRAMMEACRLAKNLNI